MRKTKIVCTIGPATDSEEMLSKLVDAGMNVARLNTSHGDVEEHRRKIKLIKKIREERKIPLAILLDLSGPKIRTGYLEKDEITLKEDSELILTTEDVRGNERILSISYTGLPSDVKPGDRILLSDGAIELEVLETDGLSRIKTRVVNGGRITHRRGVNVPGVDLKGISSITDRDIEFMKLGVEERVDYFALSFVRKPEDVELAKRSIEELGGDQPVISKIETLQALNNLEDIVEKSDGIMVARGDLGVEIPLEEVPVAQKRIINTANRMAKPVITATQMLESMVENPRPTRAEVTDIANAILDGTDAIMLSEETAVGRYPLEAVRYMDRVARETEEFFHEFKSLAFDWMRGFTITVDVSDAISHACWHLSEDLDAALIITSTSTGSTARRVSRFRPRATILAPTPDEKTYYRLSLVWGVIPVKIEFTKSTDEMIEMSLREAESMGLLKNGDRVIITAGIPWGKPGSTNMIKVHEV